MWQRPGQPKIDPYTCKYIKVGDNAIKMCETSLTSMTTTRKAIDPQNSLWFLRAHTKQDMLKAATTTTQYITART